MFAGVNIGLCYIFSYDEYFNAISEWGKYHPAYKVIVTSNFRVEVYLLGTKILVVEGNKIEDILYTVCVFLGIIKFV